MLNPKQVVDEYYLEVRCKLLEIAAIFDRVDRAVERTGDASARADARLQKCRDSLAILNAPTIESNRAEQISLVFSDPPIEE
jgi:hypothetical protein